MVCAVDTCTVWGAGAKAGFGLRHAVGPLGYQKLCKCLQSSLWSFQIRALVLEEGDDSMIWGGYMFQAGRPSCSSWALSRVRGRSPLTRRFV